MRLDLKTRSDGSVFLTGASLPFFSVVGADLRDALTIAADILPAYLDANAAYLIAEGVGG
jgi:hypothetical protein